MSIILQFNLAVFSITKALFIFIPEKSFYQFFLPVEFHSIVKAFERRRERFCFELGRVLSCLDE
jgi:hypothetical protein